jgi:hypothetical protein
LKRQALCASSTVAKRPQLLKNVTELAGNGRECLKTVTGGGEILHKKQTEITKNHKI